MLKSYHLCHPQNQNPKHIWQFTNRQRKFEMNGASLKGCAYNAGWVKIRLRSPQRQSWRVLPGPQWTQRAHIIGVSQFCIPSNGKIQFWPKFVLFCWSNTTFWLFWSPFWASSQRWRHNLWGKPQNISERYWWSGVVICRYFSSRNSCEN